MHAIRLSGFGKIAAMHDYVVTSDPLRVDVDAVHQFLANSYWARGIPKHLVERAISNSVCFNVLSDDQQVGFARVVTDKAAFAYLADVYILEPHRGKGLSKRLMEAVRDHPDLQGLRRMMLATRDAHGLYSRFGFKGLAAPDRFMEAHNPDAYQELSGR